MNHATSCRAGLLGIALLCVSAAPAAPISIVNNVALAFGKFAAGTGGTITMSPAGARSTTGGVILISSGTGSAARFTVSGDLVTYSILLPEASVLTRTGGQTMAISNFTSSPSSVGTLTGGGSQIVTVGATLAVSSTQMPGAYTGTFDMTVNYN